MLKIRDLYVNYGYVQAVKGLNLEAKTGNITVLIGSNGAGKTTTLKTISGLLKPSNGEIYFNTQRIDGIPAYKISRMGVILCPERRGIFSSLSVIENLRAATYSRKDKKIKQDLEKIFELFPILAERRKQAAGTLSGGEQQMLAIARALMAKPKLLMLDEPSLGLAPKIVNEIFDTLLKIKEQDLITILLVEQNAFLSLEIADYAYVMKTGQIVSEGPAKDIMKERELIEKYLGG
ncbi:MAG: branched-chain amino acid transport system ATP-binding protein [Thermotogaceae bacterium]|nr:branched-chain amino acid transport system ATP-binding protein [Thermotogaceae bacterium]MDN5337905.1 branched-chain amino acid transport system ATP-binding protein [Thermotogaceae bacterium]